MFLIYPPVSIPSEPPAGVARLCGALKACEIPCTVWDANLEGILFLLQTPSDSKVKRYSDSAMHVDKNLSRLQNLATYQNIDKYKLAVKQLNLHLENTSKAFHVTIGMSDFQHRYLSPVRTADLFDIAEHPESSIFFPFFKERLIQFLEEIDTAAVGFSLIFLSQALTTFAMIGFLKKHFPRIQIILGGGLMTSWMKNTGWQNPFGGLVDLCVSGPGEEKLISWLGRDCKPPAKAPPNYSWKALSEYLSPARILPYDFATGCYWRKCTFCPETAEKQPYKLNSANNPLFELNNLADQHKPELIHVLDNAIHTDLLNQFSAHPLPAPWYGYVRFTENLEDIDFCRALRKSNCIMLQLGLESGSQTVLNKMKKGIDLQSATIILKNLKAVGIEAFVYLLFGTLDETEKDARETMDFVVHQSESIRFLNAAIFNMPVLSSETEKLTTRPFYEGDLALYTDFEHPNGWNRIHVRHFIDRVFKRHSVIASILRRTPPVFTSNHAPFFLDAFQESYSD